MTQITLTLDLTTHNATVLAEVLPRFEMYKPGGSDIISAVTPENDTPQTSALKEAVTSGVTPDKTEEKKPTPQKVKADKPKDAAPMTENKSTTESPSMTDVRAVALKLSKAGKQNALKTLFAKYNADKLSGIAESDYPALLKDLEAANAES